MVTSLMFGIFADPIPDQLSKMGIAIDPVDAEHFEKDMRAISRAKVRGLLTDSEGNRAYDRLGKRIRAALAKAEGRS